MNRFAIRLLYVEDDPDIRGALGDLLEAAGYEVRLAASATEGLSALGQELFDLVITDYNLPDFNGARMLREAAETGSLQCESLILTGASVLDGTAGFRILRKPIDIDKLLSKVEEVLAPVLSRERGRPSSDPGTPARGPRFSTGVPGLDAMMGGGCLRETSTLLRGPPGSGKTTLAALCAGAAASRGERVAFFGFEEPRHLLLRNIAALRREDAEGAAARLRIECRSPDALSPEALLRELRQSLEAHEPSVVVVDSLSAIADATSPRRFRHFVVALAGLCREKGRSAVMTQTLTGPAAEGARAPELCGLMDCLLDIEHHREDDQLLRRLWVVKMRGSAHSGSPGELTIDEHGVSVQVSASEK